MPTSHHSRPGLAHRLLAAATTAALVAAGAIAGIPAAHADAADPPSPAPVLQRSDDHVTADNLPTVQIDDGYVWAQTTIGTTVYAAGQFTNTRPAGAAAGTSLTPRSNILAYNITTGDLITAFAPTVNGVIKAVAASPDGKRIYIGGTFDTVNGQNRWGFAVLDATTGKLVPGISPAIGGSGVYAITATAGTVYVGGLFTQANGVARTNLAAFDTDDGALLAWAPTTDRQVDAMVMEPGTGKVVVGGRFYSVNSTVQRGLANLDPQTGAINTSWQAPNTVQNGWNSGSNAGSAGIFGLGTDKSGVYGTGWVFSNVTAGNLEGVFAADSGTGKIRWVSDCHGDHYGVYSTGSVVYTADHTHQCETVNMWPNSNPQINRYVESYTADARGTLTKSSTAGSTYKDWSGTPSPSAYDWFPDFTVGTTSGLGQAALSVTGAAGYVSVGGEFGSVNNGPGQGLTRFSTKPPSGPKQGPRVRTADWTPTASSGNPGTAHITIPANWDRDDQNLTYTLNRKGSSEPVASTTVASQWWNLPTVGLTDTTAQPGSSQTYTVRATDGDGNSVVSSPVTVPVAAGVASTYANAVLQDGPSLYYRLGGSTVDLAGSNKPVYGNGVTRTTPGGVDESGSAGSTFSGTSSGVVSSTSTAPAPAPRSEEAWFRTTTRKGGALLGYGSSQTGSSSSHDRQIYMTNAGKLVFGVYPGSVQTITTPKAYNDGSWHHVVAIVGPDGMKLYVDGAQVASKASATGAQSYTGYWRIGGDSLSGSWPSQPSSSYFAGSMSDVAVYPAVLSTQQVRSHYLLGRGQTPPTAAFTSTSDGPAAAFDASSSAAGTGHSISSYSWNWGDGTATGTGRTATHTYAEAGTYTVTLTVTDDRGATDTASHRVTATARDTAAGLASDGFDRTASSGWGTADKGGPWTTLDGSATTARVVDDYGQLALDKGDTRSEVLKQVSTQDVALQTWFSPVDAPATGSSYVGLLARQNAAGDNYRIFAWLRGDGTAWLVTQHGGNVLNTSAVPGITWAAGDSFNLKAQATGSGPTSIRAKLWKSGSTEPSSWQITSTDSTAALQSAGSIGVSAYRASSATAAGTYRFKSFQATAVD